MYALKNTLSASCNKFALCVIRACKTHWRLLLVLSFLGVHGHAMADVDVSLPQMNVAGVDTSQDDPITIFWKYAKYVLKVILWAGVMWAAVSTVFATIKAVHQERKKEDAKWGDVAKDILGHLIVTILVLLLALWANGFLH